MQAYPLPAFHFSVVWGGSRIDFTEVTGLSVEVKTLDYRGGTSPEYNVTKMPGMQEFQHIVLKRGIFNGDNEFHQWLSTIKLNDVERRDITVSLLNGDHQPVMNWKIKNAWPVKMEGPSLNSTNNEVAIETLELCHEGITTSIL